MGAFDIDLNDFGRAERADNDVAGHAHQLLGGFVLAAGQLPDETVIESELLDLAVADAVATAVADVADPGAVGMNQQGGAGGAHVEELAILLTARVNTQVGFDEGPLQRLSGAFVGM